MQFDQSLTLIFACTTLVLLSLVLYLLDGYRKHVDEEIRAIRKQLEDIVTDISFIRRGLP